MAVLTKTRDSALDASYQETKWGKLTAENGGPLMAEGLGR